ncbi:MAG: RNA polymerase sigma factor [Candidatus Eisenbacteria bacterium]
MTEPKTDPALTRALGTTVELLTAIRGGDEAALHRLVEIYRPLLERWARGRLPGTARGLVETSDLVQLAFVRVLARIDQIDAQRPGALLAYLRRTIVNQMRNEIRNASRRPIPSTSVEGIMDVAARSDTTLSPLDEAIGAETVDRYEDALSQLPEAQQIAVILRIEFGCGHGEIAEAIGSPSANAARMVVSRALVKMAELMDPGPQA